MSTVTKKSHKEKQEKPEKEWTGKFIVEFANQLSSGQFFTREDIQKFCAKKYDSDPKTVYAGLRACTINAEARKGDNNCKGQEAGRDLFFQVDRLNYRPYKQGSDPKPFYFGDKKAEKKPKAIAKPKAKKPKANAKANAQHVEA
jgi:hypothetical protein